jgi:hypothetical protein
MVFAFIAACDGDDNGPGDNGDRDPDRYDNTRDIEVAIWWDPANNIDSNYRTRNPDARNPEHELMQMDNMRAIEEKYNIRLVFVDLTFNGVRESIGTSVMAGTPDVDVYLVDLQWAIPIVQTGLCIPITDFAPADSDLFAATPKVMAPLNIAGMPNTYLFQNAAPGNKFYSSYSLGFNQDLLEEFGQPCPQDLWDDDQWTWETWLNIMRAVTDSTRGTWGYSGAHVHDTLHLLMSNGAGIALGATEGLSSAPTMEVLNFLHNIYVVERVARWGHYSVVEYWENSNWTDGTLAFFPWSVWRAESVGGLTRGHAFGDYEDCDYVIRNVHWPIGPSGNKATNATVNEGGNAYMIPRHTRDPHIVFDVLFSYYNWFDYDLSIRDEDLSQEDHFGDDIRGFNFVLEMFTRPQFDMYTMLGATNAEGQGFAVDAVFIADDEGILLTPAQFSESWRNIIQDYIDVALGKR